MRVLIVGGGIAGLTLAAKLRQQGREPVIVERQPRYGEHGYSLGLYGFGSCVLHGLGIYEQWRACAAEITRYEMANEAGEVISSLELDEMARESAPMYDTTHADLVKSLLQACGGADVRMGTTVTHLEQKDETVAVTFNDGSSAEFDLVCGCDGIHSSVRSLVFGDQPVFDTGWVAWTWWGSPVFPASVVREYWLNGAFFGTYPVPGKSTYVVAVPTDQADPKAGLPASELMPRLKDALGSLLRHEPGVEQALSQANDLWPWKLNDVRAGQLHQGRVVLCGDSGTAFLPTAGLGASNALRSAAVLADELSRADARLVPLACELYVKRAASVVRKNQESSRMLAKAMFLKGRGKTWARDELMKHLPARAATKQIIDLMNTPM